MANRKMGIRGIAEAVGLSYGTTQRAIKDELGFKKLFARWVPSALKDEQKRARVANAREVLALWGSNWDELMSRLKCVPYLVSLNWIDCCAVRGCQTMIVFAHR